MCASAIHRPWGRSGSESNTPRFSLTRACADIHIGNRYVFPGNVGSDWSGNKMGVICHVSFVDLRI